MADPGSASQYMFPELPDTPDLSRTAPARLRLPRVGARSVPKCNTSRRARSVARTNITISAVDIWNGRQ